MYHCRSVIIIYLSFVPLITGKIASSTGKRSFSRSQSMSKDDRKMSPVHVTLKVGVIGLKFHNNVSFLDARVVNCASGSVLFGVYVNEMQ